MALVNIGQANKDDGFYRYKMPKIITKIEGRGNGIKTNIVNMVDVAKALARPPSYTTKYFGCVLGAQSKFDDKTNNATVNGAHDTAKLVQILESFIKKYVQCYGCGNPETEVIITKSQMITLKCAACGFVSDVDMRDKLTTFILNNPPEAKKSKASKIMRRAEKERLKAGEALDEDSKKPKSKISKDKKTDGEKKSKKKSKDAEEDPKPASPTASVEEDEANDDDDDVEWQTDTSAEAAKVRIQEQLTAATSAMVIIPTAEEPKPAAKKEENAASSAHSNGHHLPGDSNGKAAACSENGVAKKAVSDPHADLVEELLDFIKTRSLSDVVGLVDKQGLSQDFFDSLFEALMDGTVKGFAKEVKKKKSLFSKLIVDERTQAVLLNSVERFFGVKSPAAGKEIALVLKELYDEDILEEDCITQWFEGKTPLDSEAGKNVRKHATPFVNWLKEAESEEDDE